MNRWIFKIGQTTSLALVWSHRKFWFIAVIFSSPWGWIAGEQQWSSSSAMRIRGDYFPPVFYCGVALAYLRLYFWMSREPLEEGDRLYFYAEMTAGGMNDRHRH